MKPLKISVRTRYKSIRARMHKSKTRPSNSLEQFPELSWKPTCKETYLLAECFVQNEYLTTMPRSPSPADGTGFLDRVESLLKAGADPNITICAYEVREERVHRILGEEDTSDFVEGTYEDIRGMPVGFDKHTDFAMPPQPQLSSMITPFIRSVVLGDIKMIAIFLRYGINTKSLLAHLEVRNLSKNSEQRMAFVPPRLQLMRDFLSSTDVLSDSFLQQWVLWHLTDTLHLLNSCFGHEYHDEHFLEQVRGDDLDERRMKFCAIPQQAIQLAKDKPLLLSALLNVMPPVHGLVVLDDSELLSIALEVGCNVHDADFQQVTALHIAAGNVTSKMCEKLIEVGVDVNARDGLGITPLLEAVYFGHLAMVRMLLDAGAALYPDSENPASRTSEHDEYDMLWGEWRGFRNKHFARFFRLKWSILHIAIWQGSWDVVQLLVDRGADLTLEDASGRTALDLSIELARFKITAKLLDIGAPFDSGNVSASLLLGKAISEQENGVANQLVARGVKRLPTNVHALAYAEGSDMGYHEDSLSQLLLGQELNSQAGQVWHLGRRLPPACCPHVDNPRLRLNHSTPAEICTITMQTCSVCLLLEGHRRFSEAESIPVGAMMSLILRQVRETQTWQLITVVSKSQLQHTLAYVTAPWHTLLETISYLNDRSTGASAATATSVHWLLNCAESHKECHSQNHTYVPTRLVEVLDHETVRIVENPSSQPRYVALSHRWGQDEASRTTSTNFMQRQSSFSADQLSPTLRDAINAVQGLGYRFLWVDVLCIIQDSDDDWLHEASEMCHVYSNAAVTIAAECADEEHTGQGMFRDRTIQESRPFHFRHLEHYADEKLEHLIRTAEMADQELYIFPATGDRQRGNRPKGILDTRGWILQEQLLSPRILYYGRQQLYWDCISQSASEISPLAASLLNDPQSSETWAFRLLRRTIAGNGELSKLARLLADVWIHVVQNYSARSLTKSSDKLIALQGVVSAVEKVLGTSSIAGMWQQDLWKQLTWWSLCPGEVECLPDTTFSAPTWSWLSASGAVLHHQSMRIDCNPIPRRLNDLTPVPSLECAITAQHYSTTSISGELNLCTLSFTYYLTSNDLREITWKRGHPAKLNLAPARWMLDRGIELPRDIECVVIAEDEVAKMTVAMCLVSDGVQTERWRRVGLCLWDGLAWQIERYLGKELEVRRFIVV